MTSKVMELYFPEDLIQAIETRAKATSTDQNTVVVDILVSAFGLPSSSQVPVTEGQLVEELVEEKTSQLSLANMLLQAEIVKRKQISATLSQEKEFISALIRNLPIGVISTDESGKILLVNSAYEEICGYSSQELVGQSPPYFYWDVANQEGIYETFLRSLSGQSEKIELWFTRKNGERFLAQLHPIALFDAYGNLLHHLAVIIDITEGRQAEKALQESEEKYRSLFELANDSILIIDAETQGFLNVNWNAARRLGYTRSEVLNLAIEDISLPMSAQRQQALEQELRINGNVVFEHIYRCKDGVEIPVEISSQIIEYDNRLAIQSFVRDISKRKRTREAFQKQREIRQTIFEHIPILIFFFDADCQIQLINRETEEVLGWSLAELQKIDLWSQCYPHPEYRQMVIEHMQTADAGWQDFQTRVRDGRLLDISWTTVQLSDGTLIGIGRDVTQRKHSERELRQAHSELEERSEKLIELNHQLQSTLEELRTAEEELLVQNETIAKAHQQLEIEVRHYQDLFDLAPDAYLLTDSEGVIEEANQAAAELLSCEQEHLLGKALKEFIPPGERRAFLGKLSKIREPQSPYTYQLRLKLRSDASQQIVAKVNAKHNLNKKILGFRWLMRQLVTEHSESA
ncbi:PAS domain S-box protein [Lyngbya aestuarii]|uniref:PAS domain S-box protein n=1 Tax=Lyngbya aestuarii TaxID=118322 RepID=UPI00403DE3A5